MRHELQAILDSLDDASRGLREADEFVVASDGAAGDGIDALRQMLDAQARVIEQHRKAMVAHRVAIDAVIAANRAAVDLLNRLP